MLKVLKTTAIMVAFMTVSLSMAFAQNNSESNASVPSAFPTITVGIQEKGAYCPDNGTVEASWVWKWPVYPYPEGITTSYANYANTPCTVVLPAQYPGSPWGDVPLRVIVRVEPSGHPEAKNSLIVYPPFSPIILNPGPCDCHNCEGPQVPTAY